jgi:hypothetical protein
MWKLTNPELPETALKSNQRTHTDTLSKTGQAYLSFWSRRYPTTPRALREIRNEIERRIHLLAD